MQSFTKNEITWMIDALDDKAQDLNTLRRSNTITELERSLCILRIEQLTIITDKLCKAVEGGDKRIEIRY